MVVKTVTVKIPSSIIDSPRNEMIPLIEGDIRYSGLRLNIMLQERKLLLVCTEGSGSLPFSVCIMEHNFVLVRKTKRLMMKVGEEYCGRQGLLERALALSLFGNNLRAEFKFGIDTSCAHCQKIDALQLCGGCRQKRYCSVLCQSAHWSQHKDECNRSKINEMTSYLRRIQEWRNCGVLTEEQHKLLIDNMTKCQHEIPYQLDQLIDFGDMFKARADTVRTLESSLVVITEKLKNAQELLGKRIEECEQLNVAVQKRKEKIESLKEKNTREESRAKEMKVTLKEKNLKIREFEKTMKEMTRKIKGLEKELGFFKADPTLVLRAQKFDEMKVKLKEKEDLCLKQLGANSVLKEKLQDKEAEIQNLKKENAEQRDLEYSNIELEHENLSMEYERLQKENQELKLQVESKSAFGLLKVENDDLKEKNEELKKKMESRRVLKKENERLKRKLDLKSIPIEARSVPELHSMMGRIITTLEDKEYNENCCQCCGDAPQISHAMVPCGHRFCKDCIKRDSCPFCGKKKTIALKLY